MIQILQRNTILVGCVTGYAGVATSVEDRTALESQGWMVCDGRSLSTPSYPELFSVLGYRYGGAGDTFAIPKLASVPVTGSGNALLSIICYAASVPLSVGT